MAFCAFNVLLAERAWGRMGKASTNPPCSHQIYTKSAAEDGRTSSCCSSCSWWGCISHRWRFSLFCFSCSKRIWAEMLMWQVVVIITIINNCIAKWRLSAWDIQELSLLAASSKMKTALPWLANPGNPAISRHIGKGNRHWWHWKNIGNNLIHERNFKQSKPEWNILH